ncbi:replication protein A 70 kDa DNA-binding subunit C-like protein [Tanacetum coccineum]
MNKFSKHNVYSTQKILGVKSVSVKKLHGYGHLEEIVVKRVDGQLYKFKEGDFVDLHLNDIEDTLLLAVQHKLFHLNDSDIVDFIMALRMFTRSLIIKRRVEDLHLGVESCQKKLNITAPQKTFPEIEFKEFYTPSHKPPGVIYEDLNKQKRVMRADELYKFSNGTLKTVRDELHHRILDFYARKTDHSESGAIGWYSGTRDGLQTDDTYRIIVSYGRMKPSRCLTCSLKEGKPTGSNSASKATTLSGSSQPKPLLFLDQLEVDVTGTIVVMIGRVWDVNAATGRYLSTNFVVSDSKVSAKSSVAHNFLRLKVGGIYSINNFVVLPNKDEFRIFRHDMFMIEFDRETTARKVSADPHGFHRYPFRLIEFDQVKPANNKYSRGELGDVLVEKKTKHAGVYAMVLTGMSGKEYNNKSYLSSTSSTVFYDDDDIPCLQELRADDSRAAPSKAPLPIDCSQPREGTTKKGWNYPSCGYEKCRKGATRKLRKWVCEACNRAVDYLVFRYRLEVVVVDDTTRTVVVMFNDTATELLKYSVESLMGTEDEYSDADNELNLPVAIRNLIGTKHVLEIKSHTYYEYGSFKSFNDWKINPNPSAEDGASSSTPAMTANDVELSMKIVTKPPTVCTPLKPNEEKKQKGHDLEDSDVDEVSGPLKNTGKSNADVAVDNKKKRKRQDGRVQSYCGLRLIESMTDYSGINPLPFPDTTRLNSADIASPLTSKYASTRLPRRSAGPTHLRKAKKEPRKWHSSLQGLVQQHTVRQTSVCDYISNGKQPDSTMPLTVSEVAAIIINDFGDAHPTRDINGCESNFLALL